MQIAPIFSLIPPYLNDLILENIFNLVIKTKITKEIIIVILILFFNTFF